MSADLVLPFECFECERRTIVVWGEFREIVLCEGDEDCAHRWKGRSTDELRVRIDVQ